MAESSFPWTGTTPGSAGPYSADQFANILLKLLAGGQANNGPVPASLGSLVYGGCAVIASFPAAASVRMLAGAALVNGTFYENTTTITFPVAANASGNPRIDTIVLRKDWALQTVVAALKQGTPAGSPAPPGITQSAGILWEIPLADIAVANGFATITAAEITPRAEWAMNADMLVLRNVLNNSGVTLNTGDVVVWDNTVNNAVKRTTQGGDPTVAGAWIGRTNNGAVGRVLVRGQGFINMGGTFPAVGDRIEASATAGAARISILHGNLGRILEPNNATKLHVAYIDVQHPSEDYVLIRDEKTAGTHGGGFTSGAWRTRDLNTEVADTGSMATLAANQITLKAGIYRVAWTAPAREVDFHKTRLQDVTGGAPGTTLIIGTVEDTDAGTGTVISNRSVGQGRITLTVDSILELQHQCTTTKVTNGFGAAGGFSVVEVYSTIEFFKEG